MTDDRRLREIQNKLIKHIESELKDGDDYVYVATMLVKHSMVLYRTFLDEKEVCKMLDHVGKTITKEAHGIENYIDTDNIGNPPTVH